MPRDVGVAASDAFTMWMKAPAPFVRRTVAALRLPDGGTAGFLMTADVIGPPAAYVAGFFREQPAAAAAAEAAEAADG